jgi:hypothetical protein
MTALNRTPQNTNLLQPSKFILTFGRLPTVQFFCQEANIPGVSLGTAEFNTPLVDVPLAGNKLTYSEFDVSFMVDEEIQSWSELYKWFLAIAAPTSIKDRDTFSQQQSQASIKQSIYSDATLTIMSALNNPLVRVNFHRMYPISLSDVKFDTQQSADTIITATATFRYEYFDITNA